MRAAPVAEHGKDPYPSHLPQTRRIYSTRRRCKGPRDRHRIKRSVAASDQLQLPCAPDRLAAMIRRQLAVDAPEVRLDGVHRDVHLGGDLCGAEHARQVPEHLTLRLPEL